MSWRRSWVARRTAPTSSSRPSTASSPSTRRSSSGAVSGIAPVRSLFRCQSRARRHYGGGCSPSSCSRERGPGRDRRWTGPRETRRGGTVHFPRPDAVLRGWARGLASVLRGCGGPTCPGWGPRNGGAGSDAPGIHRTCRRGSSRQAYCACPSCAPAPSSSRGLARRSCEEFRQ